MRRRAAMIVLGTGAAALLPRGAVWPQQLGRTYRLGGLTPVPRSAAHWVALLEELRRDGFVEGENTAVTGFATPSDGLDAAAARLVALPVDAILTGGTGPTRAAQRATTTIPILTVLDDFIAQSFVASLARPGGNITGVSILGPELNGKRQETLLELLPMVRRIAALFDPGSTSEAELLPLREAARARGVTVSFHAADRQPALAPAIEAVRAAGAEALNVLASQLFNVNRVEIMTRVAAARLPAIYQWPEWIAEGGLIAYGPRFTTVYRQVARQLVRVLRGTPPGEIPIEQPTRVELAINRRTAGDLGLAVPPAMLALADAVIE